MNMTSEVSPYLQRPLRSLEEVLRLRAERQRWLAQWRVSAPAGAEETPEPAGVVAAAAPDWRPSANDP